MRSFPRPGSSPIQSLSVLLPFCPAAGNALLVAFLIGLSLPGCDLISGNGEEPASLILRDAPRPELYEGQTTAIALSKIVQPLVTITGVTLTSGQGLAEATLRDDSLLIEIAEDADLPGGQQTVTMNLTGQVRGGEITGSYELLALSLTDISGFAVEEFADDLPVRAQVKAFHVEPGDTTLLYSGIVEEGGHTPELDLPRAYGRGEEYLLQAAMVDEGGNLASFVRSVWINDNKFRSDTSKTADLGGPGSDIWVRALRVERDGRKVTLFGSRRETAWYMKHIYLEEGRIRRFDTRSLQKGILFFEHPVTGEDGEPINTTPQENRIDIERGFGDAIRAPTGVARLFGGQMVTATRPSDPNPYTHSYTITDDGRVLPNKGWIVAVPDSVGRLSDGNNGFDRDGDGLTDAILIRYDPEIRRTMKMQWLTSHQVLHGARATDNVYCNPYVPIYSHGSIHCLHTVAAFQSTSIFDIALSPTWLDEDISEIAQDPTVNGRFEAGESIQNALGWRFSTYQSRWEMSIGQR